jgi:hypothetical protein
MPPENPSPLQMLAQIPSSLSVSNSPLISLSEKNSMPYGSRSTSMSTSRSRKKSLVKIKEFVSGAPAYISVIASHNYRIKCLLDKIYPNSFDKNTNFQHCAIIKISFFENNINTELIHSGELNDNERKNKKIAYYKKQYDDEPQNFVVFNQPAQKKINTEETLQTDINFLSSYVFYFIVNGESGHDIKKSKQDSNITENGIQQATNAAYKLYDNIVKIKNIHDISWFASDLARSRETIVYSIREIIKNVKAKRIHIKKDVIRNEIIILPCASELSTSGSGIGNCDAIASTHFTNTIAKQNYPSCTSAKINEKKDDCHNIRETKINWDLYFLFYGNKMRNENVVGKKMNGIFGKNTIQRCRNTNMIAMVMFFIQNLKYNTISFDYGKPVSTRENKQDTRKKSLLMLDDNDDNKNDNNFEEYQSQISNFINDPKKRSATIKSRKPPGSVNKKGSRKKRFIFF